MRQQNDTRQASKPVYKPKWPVRDIGPAPRRPKPIFDDWAMI